MAEKVNDISLKPVPEHVAIIMDGNGRWAKERGLERSAGHVEGVTAVHRITQAASDLGVKYLTLYAFSTENWNRPQAEVDALMHLISIALEQETPSLIANNAKLEIIGDIDRMPAEARRRLDKSMAATAQCTGLTVVVAFSYSSRWEITRACAQIAREVAAGEYGVEDITAETVSQHLATAKYPDPDLLIRTGGDMRVSNFLLWQIAYSEIFVTPTYWPEFSTEEFEAAIDNYRGRERRFGLTSEQINPVL
ncbi:MAG: isoprenyl transferase [Lachnospiraceae bacterium]|nr:isoprenyl transferase [Lachnospiraceae bacterium]